MVAICLRVPQLASHHARFDWSLQTPAALHSTQNISIMQFRKERLCLDRDSPLLTFYIAAWKTTSSFLPFRCSRVSKEEASSRWLATFYSVLEWITIAIPRILNVQDEKTAIDNRFWIWKLLWLCSIDSLSYCGLLGNVPGTGARVPRMPLVSNSMRNFYRSYFYRASSWCFAIKRQQTKRRRPSRGNRNFRTSRWLDERSIYTALPQSK